MLIVLELFWTRSGLPIQTRSWTTLRKARRTMLGAPLKNNIAWPVTECNSYRSDGDPPLLPQERMWPILQLKTG